jgi:hypothetical protein
VKSDNCHLTFVGEVLALNQRELSSILRSGIFGVGSSIGLELPVLTRNVVGSSPTRRIGNHGVMSTHPAFEPDDIGSNPIGSPESVAQKVSG